MPDARLQRTRAAYQTTVVLADADVRLVRCGLCGGEDGSHWPECARKPVEPTAETPWAV